jgi:sortase A
MEPIPSENTLIIKSLGMREKIFEGESIYTVNRGVWRRPHTSTPDQGGNTVMVGHRFTYSGQSVFYNLDKVKQGDEITVFWNSKAYTYVVDGIGVVPPEAVEVEAPTAEPRLTLYTCAPLLTAKDRLVIRAKLL